LLVKREAKEVRDYNNTKIWNIKSKKYVRLKDEESAYMKRMLLGYTERYK
jgi:hypothetical protein